MRRRLLSVLFIVSLTAIAGMVIAVNRFDRRTSWNGALPQIKFSHKLHLEGVGAECSMCHPAAQVSENANDAMLPAHEQCAVCHTAEVEGDCQFCHLDPENAATAPAPEREIRFSHKNHVDGLHQECAVCHAGIETSEKPSLAFLPAMATCGNCHNNVQATAACEACHSKVETLRPSSHQGVAWVKEHKRLVRVSEFGMSGVEGFSNDCAVCHSENFCQTCHAEATTQFTRGSLIRSVPENRPAPDGKLPLIKERVHDLNFVFTHALDLRSKQSDCYSCHNEQTFCADCHARNQDAGFGRAFPSSHRAADFVRLGKGSGGGQHAILARRDMESCASCHDVEGRDPACATCHMDLAPKGKRQ